MNAEQIEKYINRLEAEAKALKEEALRFCWYMRGSIQYDGAMMLSQHERTFISSLVKENIETTKKTGLNFF